MNTLDQFARVLSFQDYNTRVVLLGTTLLGAAAGSVGVFLLLRKRALLGDAISHATLPGVCIAFLISASLGGTGKSLPLLLVGAAATGLLGGLTVLLLRQTRLIKEDAALGVVLSVFFGFGLVLLSAIQQLPSGHAAGLEGFIYGKTASLVAEDAWFIAGVGTWVAVTLVFLFRPLQLLCFDESFAKSQGFATTWLDTYLMVLVVVITIVGAQAVGLILIIALLVTPAASARFWTHRLHRMTAIAACLGAGSCFLGALDSAVFPKVPSGAAIVLAAVFFFIVSMFLGTSRGLLWQLIGESRMRRRSDQEHALRGLFELLEADGKAPHSRTDQPSEWIHTQSLSNQRSWMRSRLDRLLHRLQREGLLILDSNDRVRLSRAGVKSAERLVRDHRLWELYLLEHAEFDPSQVDRGADAIEHVVDADIVERLSAILDRRNQDTIPPSPHPLKEQSNSSRPPEENRT